MPQVAPEPRERLGRAHRGLRGNLVPQEGPGLRELPGRKVEEGHRAPRERLVVPVPKERLVLKVATGRRVPLVPKERLVPKVTRGVPVVPVPKVLKVTKVSKVSSVIPVFKAILERKAQLGLRAQMGPTGLKGPPGRLGLRVTRGSLVPLLGLLVVTYLVHTLTRP